MELQVVQVGHHLQGTGPTANLARQQISLQVQVQGLLAFPCFPKEDLQIFLSRHSGCETYRILCFSRLSCGSATGVAFD